MNDIDDVLAAGEQALQERWPGCRLDDPRPFHGQGSSRNVVLRAAVRGGGADSVVVKRHRSGAADEWAVREPAALSMLPRGKGFLELLAVGDDLIVLADLGDGGHDPDPRLPRLTDLAEQVVTAATAAWGPQPLALAPAFRPR